MTYSAGSGWGVGSVNGVQPSVLVGANIDLSGQVPIGQPGNCFSANGQLMIGRTTPNAFGTNTQMGFITSNDGSINVQNGAGTINLSGQASGFQPNAVLQLFDDFVANVPASLGELQWTYNNSPSYLNSTADHPGIVQLVGGVISKSYFLLTNLSSNDPHPGFILGNGAVFQSFTASLVTLSALGNRYYSIVGLVDDITIGAAPVINNGVYFSYKDDVNGGQWQINSAASGVTTTTNTSVVALTGFTTFGISINASATLVTYFINGLNVGTISTNIPTTANMFPNWSLLRVSGSLPNTLIDLFWMTFALSNPRPGPLSPTITGTSGRQLLSYTATAISYQVLGTDAIIGVTNNSAARTITMPNSGLQAGQVWTVKDEAGTAQSANNITISGNGSNIDGASTYVINTNFGSVQLYWSGSAFFII